MSCQELTKKIHERFRLRQMSLAVAESCTGGALAAQLVSIPGASEFFLGGVVAYSNEAKVTLLDVKKSLLAVAGAVSLEVALQMAQGARKKMKSTWAMSTTGIAGPTGGLPHKPVGTVCMALVGPGFEYKEKNLFSGTRESITALSVKRALELIVEYTH